MSASYLNKPHQTKGPTVLPKWGPIPSLARALELARSKLNLALTIDLLAGQ